MSKLIMWNLVTLDGYFDGAQPWDLGWHDRVFGDELEQLSIDQLRSAERLLFGRITYEGMAAYWTTEKGVVAELMNAIPKTVFSRTLERADWNNATLVKTNAAAAVSALKAQGTNDIYVFGSGNLSETLTDAGLFDEYRLVLAPVVLGRGRRLFGDGSKRLDLKLLESRRVSSDGLILRYVPGASAKP